MKGTRSPNLKGPSLPHFKWTKELMEDINPLWEEKQSLTSPFSSWTISTDRRVSLGNSVFKSNFVQRSDGRPPHVYIWDFCMEVNRKAARLIIKGDHTLLNATSSRTPHTEVSTVGWNLFYFLFETIHGLKFIMKHLKRTTPAAWGHISLFSKLFFHPHDILWSSKREINNQNDRTEHILLSLKQREVGKISPQFNQQPWYHHLEILICNEGLKLNYKTRSYSA